MAAPDQLISSTIDYFLPMVADSFYRGSAFLMRLKSSPGFQDNTAGGYQIREPILAANPNSDWFTGDESYSAQDNGELSSAVYAWKFVRSTPMITKADLFKNQGDQAKVSLIRTKMEAASLELTERWLVGAFALATAPVANAITPLEQIVDDGNTYTVGGISSDDVSRWQGNKLGNSGSTMAMEDLFALYYTCSEGADEPTDIVMTKAGFGRFAQLLQNNQRYLDKNADAGFTNFTFNKATVQFDSHILTTTTSDFTGERAFFLNLKYLRMYTGAGLNFAAEEKAPSGQSIYTWEVVLATQLTTNARWAQGCYHDFAT